MSKAKSKGKFGYGEAINRAFEDQAFLEQLIENPEAALLETGVKIDPGVGIKVTMSGNSAGGVLHVDVKNASVNWAGSLSVTLHK